MNISQSVSNIKLYIKEYYNYMTVLISLHYVTLEHFILMVTNELMVPLFYRPPVGI